MLTQDDLYYLRSILGHLREVRKMVEGASLGGEVLADNIDWLDCFIDKHDKAGQSKTKHDTAQASTTRDD